MQAALAEVFAPFCCILVMKQAVEVLDPGVVEFSCPLYQQKVDAGYVVGLFADVMNDNPLIPSKDVDGKVVLSLNLRHLRDWCRSINSCEIKSILCWIFAGPFCMVCNRKQG